MSITQRIVQLANSRRDDAIDANDPSDWTDPIKARAYNQTLAQITFTATTNTTVTATMPHTKQGAGLLYMAASILDNASVDADTNGRIDKTGRYQMTFTLTD